jgi:DNA-binding response OmpR family regulator
MRPISEEKMSKNSSKKNVMVIEDDPEVLEMLTDFLEIKGFNVTAESDGVKALEIIPRILPDIIVMDLLLPGEHGLNLIKTVKEKHFIPIIIISGIYHEEEIESIIEEYFVEDFIKKPINLDNLAGKINKIIDVND